MFPEFPSPWEPLMSDEQIWGSRVAGRRAVLGVDQGRLSRCRMQRPGGLLPGCRVPRVWTCVCTVCVAPTTQDSESQGCPGLHGLTGAWGWACPATRPKHTEKG